MARQMLVSRFIDAAIPPFCKRLPFTLQKVTSWSVKGRLLEAKRRPFISHWVSMGYKADKAYMIKALPRVWKRMILAMKPITDK